MALLHTRLVWIAVVVCALVAACSGRDDNPAPRDAGGGDGEGFVRDGGTGDAGSGTTLRMHFIDTETRAAVEGVHVAVDVAGMRFEADTDAAGAVTLDVPRTDTVDVTAAKERYVVLTQLGGPVTQFGSDGSPADIPIPPVRPAAAPIRTIVSATGIPTGGRWCMGLGKFVNWCTDMTSLDTPIAAADVSDHMTGFAIDAMENVVDYAEVPVMMVGDTRTATFAFDTTPEVADVSRDMQIMLPADVMSTLRTSPIVTFLPTIIATSTGDYLMRGLATNVTVAAGGGSISARVHVFARPGQDLVHAMAVNAEPLGDATSIRWFAAEPTMSAYAVLDLPRITGRGVDAVYTLPFTWTVPPGADMTFDLVLTNNAGLTMWILRTPAHDGVRFPALPSAYDQTVSFPFVGANGKARVRAVSGTVPNAATTPMGMEPYRVDGRLGIGPSVGITF